MPVGLTLDQMNAYNWGYADVTPHALFEGRRLPGLRGMWGNVLAGTTWYDQSGFTNNLTLIGATTADVGIATTWPSALMPYITFDGTNDYATIADNAALSITSALTLWAIVYPAELDRDQGIVSKWLTTGNVRSYALYLNSSNQFVFAVSSNGTAETTVSSAAISKVNRWYFVCARYVPSTSLSIQIDNAMTVNTTSIPASIYDNARQLQVGQFNENSGARWRGRIAQVGLCAYAVPDAMVQQLFGALKPDLGLTEGEEYVPPVGPDEVTLYATADTYISQADANTNFGTASTMIIGVAANRRCLVKFSLATIPAGATINKATLRCYVEASLGDGVTLAVDAFRVIRTWNETQATWNVAVTGTNWGTAGCSNTTTDRDGTAEDTQNIEFGDVGGWVEWDLTSLVTEWMGGTANEGVILINNTGYSASRFTLQTREGANAPQLVVSYTEAA